MVIQGGVVYGEFHSDVYDRGIYHRPPYPGIRVRGLYIILGIFGNIPINIKLNIKY